VIDNVRTRLQQFNETVTSSFGQLNHSSAQIARREERTRDP